MRKLVKGEFCYAKNEEEAIALCEANGVTYIEGVIGSVGFCHDVPGYVVNDSDYYVKKGLKEVSFEALSSDNVITKTDSEPKLFSLCDVYVCTKDVDAYIRKGTVAVLTPFRTLLIDDDDGEIVEMPYETQLRLATLLEFSEGVLVKILNKS